MHYLKQIEDNAIDLVVTSPPYNKHSACRKCGAKDSWQNANIDYEGFSDDLDEQEYQKQQKAVITQLVRVLKPTGSIFYNHKNRIVNHKIISPEEWLSSFIIRQVIIWHRGNSPVLEPIRFMPTVEQIYWITKERATPYFTKEGFQYQDVWRINPEVGSDHPAPFPEEIPKRCINAACPKEGVVLDPYAGSGTTLSVAHKMGRSYVGIELNPKYIEMARERLKQKGLF